MAIPTMFPATPAGSRLAEAVSILNDGDLGSMTEHVSSAFSETALSRMTADQRAEYCARLFDATGGVDALRVDASGDDFLWMLCTARATGEVLRVAVRVLEEEPHLLAGFGAQFVQPPVDIVPPAHDVDEAATRLVSFVDQLAAADRFSGAFLLAHDRVALVRAAHGDACKPYAVPNRPETKFNLASMGKMFTGVAVMQLVESGKVEVEQPVGRYLDVPGSWGQITVHHLLTHTAGLGELFTPEFRAVKDDLHHVADFLAVVRDQTPEFEPGERFSYSNAGYIVLGALIEAVSGEDYYDYLTKHIFEPAGMQDTASYEADAVVPNLAVGYTKTLAGSHSALEYRSNVLLPGRRGSPAGGAYSTVDDLLCFERALRAGTLLAPAVRDQMFEGRVQRLPGNHYAYGFQDEPNNGNRIVGHGGGFAGMNTRFDLYVDAEHLFVVLCNYDDPSSTRVMLQSRQLLSVIC